jgi:hypothetical protein
VLGPWLGGVKEPHHSTLLPTSSVHVLSVRYAHVPRLGSVKEPHHTTLLPSSIVLVWSVRFAHAHWLGGVRASPITTSPTLFSTWPWLLQHSRWGSSQNKSFFSRPMYIYLFPWFFRDRSPFVFWPLISVLLFPF